MVWLCRSVSARKRFPWPAGDEFKFINVLAVSCYLLLIWAEWAIDKSTSSYLTNYSHTIDRRLARSWVNKEHRQGEGGRERERARKSEWEKEREATMVKEFHLGAQANNQFSLRQPQYTIHSIPLPQEARFEVNVNVVVGTDVVVYSVE